MSGFQIVSFVPGKEDRAYVQLRVVWQDKVTPAPSLEEMERAIIALVPQAYMELEKRRADEDRQAADVGSGEG